MNVRTDSPTPRARPLRRRRTSHGSGCLGFRAWGFKLYGLGLWGFRDLGFRDVGSLRFLGFRALGIEEFRV